ncbi:MAG: 50S ribosomal protein L4 [Planctomycetes bacterium]|nr:50S ribosomal protein L4 [Planctomycetota bacterium]
MLEIPVYDREGTQVDRVEIDEALLGSRVRTTLLKQAVVMYHANQRQGSAATKSRGMVRGSTHKLYRQKGTGRARMGASRTVIRRGGGVAFAKTPRDFSHRMPKKQRRLARNSAILAKMQSEDAIVIDQLSFDTPKTSDLVRILHNLKIERSCLVATEKHDTGVYKSARNIPKVETLAAEQLNASDILRRQKLLFTRAALESVLRPTTEASEPATSNKNETNDTEIDA